MIFSRLLVVSSRTWRDFGGRGPALVLTAVVGLSGCDPQPASTDFAADDIELQLVSDPAELPAPPEEPPAPVREVAPSVRMRTVDEPDVVLGPWVDLLREVDPDRDAVVGRWSQASDGLTVAAETGARLGLRWQPTREYDVEFEFTRRTGSNSVALIFTLGTGIGSLDFDGWSRHVAGFQMIDGRSIRDNATTVDNVILTNGTRYQATLKVRFDRAEAWLNDRYLTSYHGDGSNLDILDLWRMPAGIGLGLAAWEADTTFHTVRVRTVTRNPFIREHLVGSGRWPAPAPPPAAPAGRSFEPASEDSPITQVAFNSAVQAPVAGMLPSMTMAASFVSQPRTVAEDLARLSDEFDNPASLTSWRRLYQVERLGVEQLERIDIGQSRPGWLALVPHTSTWYQDYRGVLVHKAVAGDFVATAHVLATRRDGDGPPRSSFSLAGIMVRSPRDLRPATWRPGGEDYVFLSLGAAREPGRFAFEVKTTRSSRSELRIVDAPGPEATLQVAKIGEDVILLRREPGRPWTVHQRYHRPDLAATLQVGMTVYTDYAGASRLPAAVHNRRIVPGGRPDLVGSFDYFRFRRPQVPDALAGRSLSDASQVSDEQLLAFLGDAGGGGP